jgi:hypothetical protein
MMQLKRRIFIYVAVSVLSLGTTAFAFRGNASHTPIAGIYALVSASKPVPQEVFARNNIDGIALRYWWKTLESSEGIYDWSPVTRDILAARAHSKKVSLSIAAGIGTPAWVYAANVRQFKFRWVKSWGPPICSEQRIPIPWDPVYLSKWRTFVRAFGLRYDSDPTVVLVKITGLNGDTEETNLPHDTGKLVRRGGMSCLSSDDIAEWRQVGYSREKVEQAWKLMLDAFAESFPHKRLAIMTGPSFPRVAGFGPGIRKGGNADGKLAKELISEGIENYDDRFVVQNNGLSAFWNWKEVANVAGRVTTGYQMLWSVTGDRTCRMNRHVTPCDPRTTLASAIDRGIGASGKYFEIYTADVINPQLQDVLANAHARLASRSAIP